MTVMKIDVIVLYLTQIAIFQNLSTGLMIVILIPFIIFKQFVFRMFYLVLFLFNL